MSLKIKLISVVSAFILVLSMLFVGVLATTGSFTINLKGNVEFNIENSTLYIKDIRLSNGLTEGKTIDNFLPGFIGESFELDFGTISSDSGSVSIEIDVINTTETTYNASSSSSLSNATLTVSGTIAGDSVPLDQVATYDGISGTIYIGVQVTSSTTINLNNIVIDIAEQTGYTATISNRNDSTLYIMGDDGQVHAINSTESLELQTSKVSFAFDSSAFDSINSTSSKVFEELKIEGVDLFAVPDTGSLGLYVNGEGGMNHGYFCGSVNRQWSKWGSTTSYDSQVEISDDRYVLTFTLTADTEFSFQ